MINKQAPYSFLLAGSTNKAKLCAQALQQADSFSLIGAITPTPKKVGRDQKKQINPVQAWAQQLTAPILSINQKIDQNLQTALTKLPQPDFLLVVDFGYLIPDWLLTWPKIAPVNVHPSALPRWRGSSPGQLVLLTGQKQAAVSSLVMTSELDQGPIISQHRFTVQSHWTQADYYQHSFKLMAKHLVQDLTKFATGQIKPQPQGAIQKLQKIQPSFAPKISKTDSFISWPVLVKLLNGQAADQAMIEQTLPEDSILKQNFLKTTLTSLAQAKLVERASRAFNPWPLLWTKIPTKKEARRMQVISCQVLATEKKLSLDQVKIAGQQQASWNQVKNVIE